MVLSQVMALYKLSLSLWGNKPQQGLKAVLFKGSSVADYWRQMALRGQSLGLGNTPSQPCSGWWDTDTRGIYVFALRGFHWLQLQCVCERDRNTVWWEVRRAGTWLCHSNMICKCRDFVKFSSSGLQAWSVPQPASLEKTWNTFYNLFSLFSFSHLSTVHVNNKEKQLQQQWNTWWC